MELLVVLTLWRQGIKVITLLSGYSALHAKAWKESCFTTCVYTVADNENLIVLSCHSDFFADFEQVCGRYNSKLRQWAHNLPFYFLHIF